jgi:hypothetical protein
MRKKYLHAPKGNGRVDRYLDSLNAYKNAFLAEHAKVASWRKVAEPYKIHPNMARMIANGYDPGNRIREKLRLPDKEAVEMCPECGKVLTPYHRCGSNHRIPRIAIRLDNSESAARSIIKHMDPGVVTELVELLQEGR